jgi:hypothetical protein
LSIQNFSSKNRLNLSESWMARFDNLPSQIIRIHHGETAFTQQLSAGRFAHPHPAGYAKELHRDKLLRKPPQVETANREDEVELPSG